MGTPGIDAVRRFTATIVVFDYDRIASEDELLAAFSALMDGLRHELTLAAIGLSLD